jgi:3-hydroxyisobutyrate dehydrogenase
MAIPQTPLNLFGHTEQCKRIIFSFMQKVALIGLGAMGSGMAGQLLKGGFPLAVYNRSAERAADAVKNGARLASSPREAAEGADVILAMLADDDASHAMWLGKDGALHGAKLGAVAVDCSTLSPHWAAKLAMAVHEAGCEFLDAPVTGSKGQAAAGELLFLVGGEAETLDRARPVLNAMSRGLVHLGAVGSGARMKLINNFMCGVQAAALGEALAVIERSGLDREAALDVLRNGAPGSPLVKGLSPRMTERIYDVNFALNLMQKDLRYASDEANANGVTLRTGAAALERFIEASERGWGRRDFSAVAEAARGNSLQ